MINNKKGFINLLIIAPIVLIIIVGGVYYSIKKGPAQTSTVNITTKNTDSDSAQEGTASSADMNANIKINSVPEGWPEGIPAWPTDVPFYPYAKDQHAIPMLFSKTQKVSTNGGYFTSDSVQKVTDFYEAQLTANGWTDFKKIKQNNVKMEYIIKAQKNNKSFFADVKERSAEKTDVSFSITVSY